MGEFVYTEADKEWVLHRIREIKSGMQLMMCRHVLTPATMIELIENETPLGKELIEMYIRTKPIFEKKLKHYTEKIKND